MLNETLNHCITFLYVKIHIYFIYKLALSSFLYLMLKPKYFLILSGNILSCIILYYFIYLLHSYTILSLICFLNYCLCDRLKMLHSATVGIQIITVCLHSIILSICLNTFFYNCSEISIFHSQKFFLCWSPKVGNGLYYERTSPFLWNEWSVDTLIKC